jgi:hypothetical protein
MAIELARLFDRKIDDRKMTRVYVPFLDVPVFIPFGVALHLESSCVRVKAALRG